jgi:hypothetical protein
MSRYIAKAAIRGANYIVNEAEQMLDAALKEFGPEKPVAFINTAYFLPVILGFTGMKVSKLGELRAAVDLARSMLHPVPGNSVWLPYLGETLDSGTATLLATETIEAIRFVRGQQPERLPGLRLTGTSFTSPDAGNGDGEGGGYAHGRYSASRLGHSTRRRTYAWVRGHRRRGQEQRGSRVDRP